MGRTNFAADGQNRRETTNFRVLVTPEERDVIKASAKNCGLSVSAYLRSVGLGYRPGSTVDVEQVRNLLALNTDQKRLGNLLKMWLTDREKYNETQMMSVSRLLEKIEAAQTCLVAAMDEVLRVARQEDL